MHSNLNKLIKMCSNSLVIREMPMKFTVNVLPQTPRMAKIRKIYYQDLTRMRSNWNSQFTAKNKLGQPFRRTVEQDLQKLNIVISCDLISFLNIYSTEVCICKS